MMSQIICILLCFLVISLCIRLLSRQINDGDSSDIGDGIRIMSYNILIWNKGILPDHEWNDRVDYVLSDIYKTQPDVIGFQEVGPEQYRQLKKRLKGYSSIIKWRDDKTKSEGCPIFFIDSKFSLCEQGTFWLSNTPTVMSKDWGSTYHRICTYVILKRFSDGQRFAFYNAHLDHESELARQNGIRTILDKMAQNKDLPLILTGDFNTTINSETYRIVSNELLDTCIVAIDTQDGATFHNFGKDLFIDRIDYIFCSNAFNAVKYRILSETYDGKYASDHFPIFADINLK